jgi:long-chain acyl-CoA synthetase
MAETRPWFGSYDKGIPQKLVYPQMSLGEMLDHTVKKYSSRTFTFDNEKPLSYHELLITCNRLAKNLIQAGVKQGDPIALSLLNDWKFILTFFAIIKAGAIVVGINPMLKLDEISRMLKRSNAIWMITDSNLVQVSRMEMKGLSLKGLILINSNLDGSEKKFIPSKVRVISFYELLQTKLNINVILPSISADSPAIFQFTGGTTGSPKAAIGTHNNLLANVIQFRNWLHGLKDGQETMLAAIPLTHVYGLVLAMCLGVYLGSRIVCISNPRDINLIFESIEKYKVTVFPAVPNILFGMVKKVHGIDQKPFLDSLKVVISGSSPLHPDIQKDFIKLARGSLVEGYGLSETPTATHCNPVQGVHKPGSIGLPLPDVDCRVVDIKNSKIDIKTGEVGELLIKGPQVMQGYYRNLEESRKVLKDGWLHTGDIVKMDSEGYFYLIDRKKDVIKVSGFQVWPREVEDVLASHPKVKEAGVAGIKDKRQGEKVVAWVVPNSEATITKEELRLWCRERLSAFKVPSDFEFLQVLPRTPVGKVLRRELAAMKKDPG